jgi:ABC-type multidrug transport system fused ATPase/permease subunit
MRDLSKETDTVSKAMVGYERIQEVLEIESRVRDLPRSRRAPRFHGEIEFEHVHFSSLLSISNNAGSVKHFLCKLLRALLRARNLFLVGSLPPSTKARV